MKKSDDVRKRIKDSLAAHFLFSSLTSETVEHVVDVMTRMDVKAGTVVIQQGDPHGDKFYVVEKGVYSIVVSGKQVQTYDGKKYPPANFGELALLYNQPRSATVKAETDGILWALDRLAFTKYMVGNSNDMRENFVTFLRKNPLLGKLDSDELETLAEAFVLTKFKANDTIIQQGSKGSVFYMLYEGKVEVQKAGLDKKPVLSRGEFFGEQALLHDEPRNASIVALTDCTCYALGKEDFNEMVVSLNLTDVMEKTNQKRVAMETRRKSRRKSMSRPLLQCQPKDFQNMRVIGVGAFGMVRLVKHKKSGKPYALKVGSKKEMRLETEILRSLDQRNINRLEATYDIGEKTYLVLEFLQGGDLITQICQHGTFTVSKCRHYAASVVLAFQEIHAKGVVYRDLKLENLVLDSKGTLKIVDFGLAKIIKRRTYTVCGT